VVAQVQTFAPRAGVGADQRVRHRRRAQLFFFRRQAAARIVARLLPAVDRPHVFDAIFHLRRQCFIGGLHVGEVGVSPGLRNLDGV